LIPDEEPELPEKEPPRLLSGKWLRGELVGRGFFGDFYAGEHHILGMKVGIKILRSHLTRTKESRRQFHTEAMRMSLLHHPNIVTVFDYGEEDGFPYIVMEYLEGEPLHRFLQPRRLNLEEIVEVLGSVAHALSYAHSGRRTGGPLVHLDLKPEHIFLEKIGPSWHTKVIDFGIAEIVDAQNPEALDGNVPSAMGIRRIAGTPPYMAPERIEGIADPRCDLYSLGVVFYEALTGKTPLDWQRAGRIKSFRRPPPPSSFMPKPIPRSLRKLDKIILWALQEDPRDRPTNAGAFIEALNDWRRVREKEVLLSRPAERARLWLTRVAALVLPILGLAYWAPWEKIVSQPPGEPSPPNVLEGFTVDGLGYSEARLFLQFDQFGRTYPIYVGEVSATGAIPRKTLPPCEELEQMLAMSLKGKKWPCRAQIVASGWLGRSLRSAWFPLELDCEDPGIVRFEGAFLQKETLIVPEPSTGDVSQRIVLVATEELAIAPHERSRSARTNSTTWSLDLPRDTKQLSVRLEDRWGNATVKPYPIRWVKPLRVLVAGQPADKCIRVNANPAPLAIDFEGEPRRLRVREGNSKVLIDEPDPKGVFRFHVEFSETSSGVITVEAWSPFSATEEPDLKKTFRIEYRERVLRFAVNKDLTGLSLKTIDTGVGSELASCEVKWPKEAIVTHLRSKEERPVIIDDASGRIMLADSIGSLKGKFMLNVKSASDWYGNEIDPLQYEFYYPAKPVIDSLEIDGKFGTRGQPLHGTECGCKSTTEAVEFQARITYEGTEPMEAELLIVDAAQRLRVMLKPKQLDKTFTFSVLRAAIEPYLRPGPAPNVLELIVYDPTAREEICARNSCDLFYEELILNVSPLDGSLVYPSSEDGKIHVIVDTSGAEVESVLVAGELAQRRGRNRFEAAIPFERLWEHKPITVEAKVHGVTHSPKPSSYTFDPSPGKHYVIRLKSFQLVLQFQPNGGVGQGYWFTDDASWVDLCRALSPEQDTSEGVTYAVAREVVNKLEVELAEWNLQRGSVDLPTNSQFLRIVSQNKAANYSRIEWLSLESPESKLYSKKHNIPYGSSDSNGLRVCQAKEGHKCPFRIIIPYDPQSFLRPWNPEVIIRH
jgi:serine/threonine protein kinase